MDGIVGGVPASGPSGWQGGEVFSEVQRWNRIEADGQMKTPCCLISLTENDIIRAAFLVGKVSQYGTLLQSALEAAH